MSELYRCCKKTKTSPLPQQLVQNQFLSLESTERGQQKRKREDQKKKEKKKKAVKLLLFFTKYATPTLEARQDTLAAKRV